jgi:hypothetical protein
MFDERQLTGMCLDRVQDGTPQRSVTLRHSGTNGRKRDRRLREPTDVIVRVDALPEPLPDGRMSVHVFGCVRGTALLEMRKQESPKPPTECPNTRDWLRDGWLIERAPGFVRTWLGRSRQD